MRDPQGPHITYRCGGGSSGITDSVNTCWRRPQWSHHMVGTALRSALHFRQYSIPS